MTRSSTDAARTTHRSAGVGTGEMAERIQAMDWSRTPLGPMDSWSPALRMMVTFITSNRFPVLLWWGPRFVSIYNDAYRPILGAKHPQALGQPGAECWQEIWHILHPLIDRPYRGGPSTWMEDILLEVRRHGYPEETHFTIAYSPVPDETAPGEIGGVIATVHEITDKVIGERRVLALRDLGVRGVEAKSADEACANAATALRPHARDVPFACMYLLDADRRRVRLAASVGVEADDPLCPPLIQLDDPDAAWPFAAVLASEELQVVEGLGKKFARVPAGPWADPPDKAAVIAIPSNLAHQLAGFFVVGLSSRSHFDDNYRSFIELMSTQIATAIAGARAYAEEARRAAALAELDRAKTAFFSNVSHEFRTPHPARIVLADDNRDMREYVRRLLVDRGYDVATAADGLAAVDLARSFAPALVLTDVMMPRLDGFGVLRALRAAPETQSIPVILLTARAGEEARIEGASAGADDYLTKPFNARELLARIETHLALARGRRETARILEAQRRHLRAVVDTTPDCVSIVGPDGTLLDINAAGLAMIEAPAREDVIGQSFYDLIAPEHRERLIAFNQRICRGEKDVLQFDIVNRSGTRLHMDTHAAPLEMAEWGTVHLGLTREVTAQKQVADTQRISQERFQAFVAASEDVAYRMSPDWTVMRGLDGKAFIADQDEPSRDWLMKYIHPDDQALVLARIDEAIRRKSVFELEHRVVRVDGSFGWTFSRAVPILDQDGEITEWFGAATDVTERRAAVEQLKQVVARSEQQRRLYETILSTTPDLVYVFDLSHRFSYANKALLTMWGRTWDDAIGKNCLELGYEPWHAAMHDREIQQVIATRAPIRGVVPFTGTHGRRIYDYIFVPVFGSGGQIEAVAGATRDITELKQKQDALRFLVDLDVATQALIAPSDIMGATARLLCEHLAADRCAYAEVESESVFVITGDYAKGVPSIVGRWPVSAFGAACAHGMLANEPFVVMDAENDPRITPDDLVAYQRTNIQAVICVPLHKGGRFSAAMAVHQSKPRTWSSEEIELVRLVVARSWESLQRASTLRDLAQSERQLRFMAESMPQKIFSANSAGDFDYVNPQWLRFTGKTLADILGDGWLDQIHPSERESVEQRWLGAVVAGTAVTFECRFRREDGVYQWHLTRAHPLRNAERQVVLWIGSSTDIEEQKQAEERLEQTVADRTAKLRETIAELEAFSYSIAHDLRAPLRSLRGFSEVLLEDHAQHLDAEGKSHLRRIAKAGARMDQLIQDVLNYSRVVRGDSPLSRVDVVELLQEIIETYPSFAPDKVTIDLTGAEAVVLGNKAMLTQVFSNLLGNAVKFVPPGVYPLVRVTTEPRDGQVRISIRDNGIGIDAGQHAKIFEIFQQAELGYGGTGIGLAIVKKAVERMGGTVGVNSTLGAGSEFWVELSRA